MPNYTKDQQKEIIALALANGFITLEPSQRDRETYSLSEPVYVRQWFDDSGTIEVLAVDNECVWLDRYTYSHEASVKAEADEPGTLDALREEITNPERKEA